jgi:hypothetical protein
VILTGCNTSAQLAAAAKDKGVARARVTLPALPDDCRVLEPHAKASVGDQAVSVLKAERGQLNKANARVGRCANHYDATAKALR